MIQGQRGYQRTLTLAQSMRRRSTYKSPQARSRAHRISGDTDGELATRAAKQICVPSRFTPDAYVRHHVRHHFNSRRASLISHYQRRAPTYAERAENERKNHDTNILEYSPLIQSSDKITSPYSQLLYTSALNDITFPMEGPKAYVSSNWASCVVLHLRYGTVSANDIR